MNDFFPISYWAGPPVYEDDRYAEVADCGFTVAPIMVKDAVEGQRALDMLQRHHLKAAVVDPRIHRNMVFQEGWQDVIRQVVRDYADHPAVYAYFITDEPSCCHFESLAKITHEFLRLDPQHIPYINLFPSYASHDQLGALEYSHYIRRFLEMVKPPLLSYDHYALFEDGINRPSYFYDLSVNRSESLKAGVPFWNIILSTPHFNYRDPSAEDLRWQVYTSLAYGAKGLGYFTYWTPDVENYRNGIIGVGGDRTEKYAIVRQLNREIRQLSPYLLSLRSTKVTHTPDAPAGNTPLKGEGIVLKVEGGEFVVGEFEDTEGLPWIMLVNRNYCHSAFVTLKLKTGLRHIHEVSRLTGDLREIARDQSVNAGMVYEDGLVVRFWLAPADAKLMRLS